MSEELERLVGAGPSSVHAVEPIRRSESTIPAEIIEPSLSRPASTGPPNDVPDFVLSELNDEEADNLLEIGAEAATMSPAVSVFSLITLVSSKPMVEYGSFCLLYYPAVP